MQRDHNDFQWIIIYYPFFQVTFKIVQTKEEIMEFKIICDLRENLQENLFDGSMNFSDHPPKDNIDEIQEMIKECGYECSLFGGIPELIHAVNSNMKFDN